MKLRHILILVGVPIAFALLYFIAPAFTDLLATLALAYILVLGAATTGLLMIPAINALDDRIEPKTRLRERTRIVIAIAMTAAVAVLQASLASFLLGNPASPLYDIAGQASTVQGFNIFWALWGAISYLGAYGLQESRIS